MTVPAGWYDDGSGRLRWWDGTAWTEHTMDAAPPAPASITPTPSVPEPGQSPEDTPHPAPHDTTVSPADSAESSAPWTPPTPAAPGPAASTTPAPPWTAHSGAAQPAAYPDASQTAPYSAHTPGFMPYPGASTGDTVAHDPRVAKTTTVKRRVSVLGVVGLAVTVIGVILSCIPVIAFIGWILLGLGFVASLVSLVLPGAKWPGIAGLAVGVLGGVLALAMALLTLAAASSSTADDPSPATTEKPAPSDEPSREPSPSASPSAEATPPPGAETVTFDELAVGQCIPFMEWGDEVSELPIVPCDQPHTDEVYYIFDADDGDYPGDDALQTLATERCDTAFAEYVGLPYRDSELDNYWFVPTEASWNRLDDRTIQCIVYSNDEVTESFRGSAR